MLEIQEYIMNDGLFEKGIFTSQDMISFQKNILL